MLEHFGEFGFAQGINDRSRDAGAGHDPMIREVDDFLKKHKTNPGAGLHRQGHVKSISAFEGGAILDFRTGNHWAEALFVEIGQGDPP